MNDSNGHKDHALSRIYREGSWPEPSRQIDQAILAASRRAAREHSFVRRWAPSFAIAATVVLTSTLVLKVYREQPEAVSPSVPDKAQATRAKQATPVEEPKTAEARPAAAAPPAPQPATPRGYTSTMDAGEAERLNRLQHDLDLKQTLPARESPPAAAGSPPAEKSAMALKKETSETGRASPAPRRTDVPQAPVSVFGASAPTQQSPRAAAKPALPLNQNALSAARTEPVQPQATGADTTQATVQETRAAPSSPGAAEAAASPPSSAASTDSTSSTALGGAVAARIASKGPERSPQTWIEDIRKLVAEGKLEQADRELADFKKRYPDYALPENLR